MTLHTPLPPPRDNWPHRVLHAAGDASLGVLAEGDGVSEVLVACNGLHHHIVATLGYFQLWLGVLQLGDNVSRNT